MGLQMKQWLFVVYNMFRTPVKGTQILLSVDLSTQIGVKITNNWYSKDLEYFIGSKLIY
jgi:hypothetical protein